jgi:hypothetical protein
MTWRIRRPIYAGSAKASGWQGRRYSPPTAPLRYIERARINRLDERQATPLLQAPAFEKAS